MMGGRARLWVLGAVGGSFLFAVIAAIFASDMGPGQSAGPDAYSRSAVGHEAFVRVLRRLDVPVVVSRFDSLARAGRTSLVVVAAPQPRAEIVGKLRWHGGPVALVLPKWRAIPSEERPGWIADRELRPVGTVTAVLNSLGVDGEVVRADGVAWAEGELPVPDLPAPQLIRGGNLRPLVSTRDGDVLAGLWERPEGPAVLVVSDPDLIATAGLGRGDNAALAVRLLDDVRPLGGAMVFDETAHGHQARPTVWRELMDFPLVLGVVHTLLLLGFAAWMVARRFGTPELPPPPFDAGKAFLVQNTAELLRIGGHSAHSLQRYLDDAVREVAAARHAPAGLPDGAVVEWLDALGARVGVSEAAGGLRRDVARLPGGRNDRRVLGLARRIRRWKQEMTIGAEPNP